MNATSPEWLARLAPPHAPPPVAWWPPAPGWWLLALVLLAVLAAGLWRWRSPVQRQRRAALRILKEIAASAADDDMVRAQALERLLRRYALIRCGRAAVARLSGEAWLALLAQYGGAAFAGAPGQQMLRLCYGARGRFDVAALLPAARTFVRRARPLVPQDGAAAVGAASPTAQAQPARGVARGEALPSGAPGPRAAILDASATGNDAGLMKNVAAVQHAAGAAMTGIPGAQAPGTGTPPPAAEAAGAARSTAAAVVAVAHPDAALAPVQTSAAGTAVPVSTAVATPQAGAGNAATGGEEQR